MSSKNKKFFIVNNQQTSLEFMYSPFFGGWGEKQATFLIIH